MKSNLRQGEKTTSGFEILETVDLPELEAEGIWAKHKSGTEVFHILNDDEENLFSFNFTSFPFDSSGAPHILEHSVLCGSENYPLKDAFLVLAQGSLQTYLNAWTYPDKTLYPASSVNENDYFNLMAVYGDAVFRPLLSEWTFMQEAHRLEFVKDEKSNQDRLSITGVVYNEMKGAYSSPDAYAGLWAYRSVLPGTFYDLESGGDPDHIPELSLEKLKEFHSRWYTPANCRIFLAGNIATEKQLAFLDERFFSRLAPGMRAPSAEKATPWIEPREISVSCPAGSDTKATVFFSWLCGDISNQEETLSLAALAETLLCHDGSPLTRSLIESGFGEDITPVTGLQSDLRQTVFSAGLRGVEQGREKEAAAFILNELRRFSEEGIPKNEIEAALSGMEFSHKEIRRAGGPFSLVWLSRSMRGWLHGCKPWETLLFAPRFDELKAKIKNDDHFFEKLIKKYFLDNKHRALITVQPESDFLRNKEALLEQNLKDKESALSAIEKDQIRKKSAELEQFQAAGESPQALAKIPHLSRKDLSNEIIKVPRGYEEAAGIPVITHSLYTNGISYADIALPLDFLEEDDFLWLPFFSRCAVSLGLPASGNTPALDYGEVSGLLARNTGAFFAVLHTGSQVPGSARTSIFPSGSFDTGERDWLMFRLRALDEKTGTSLELVRRIITEADFTDAKHIGELAAEMKNEMDSSFAPSGHRDAASRAGRNFSRSRFVSDMWNGLDQLLFVHRLAAMDTNELCAKLISIRDRLINGGILVNLTGNADAVKSGLSKIGSCFSDMGAVAPRRKNFVPQLFEAEQNTPEVFSSPSLQIGFAALALPAADYGSDEQAAEAVLSHQLSTGALWENIRMKGGAYGAFASPDNLEKVFSFSSYRDPSPLRSLNAYTEILKELSWESGSEGGSSSDDQLEKAIIGAYARETSPKTPAEKGYADFLRFLYGIEDRHRSSKLESLISLTPQDIAAVLKRLAMPDQKQGAVIIAGRTEAEKAAAALGTEPKELPV